MGESHETDAVQELVKLIRRERRCGVVHCAIDQPSDAEPGTAQALDAFVRRHGMTGIGEDWVELSYAAAVEHLAAVLHRDMAYNYEIMPHDRARELAARFLGHFAGGRCFTNTEDGPHEPPATGSWSWGSNPLTNATFDTGVVAVTSGQMGLLWVEDED